MSFNESENKRIEALMRNMQLPDNYCVVKDICVQLSYYFNNTKKYIVLDKLQTAQLLCRRGNIYRYTHNKLGNVSLYKKHVYTVKKSALKAVCKTQMMEVKWEDVRQFFLPADVVRIAAEHEHTKERNLHKVVRMESHNRAA